ncbi:MAG: hypothetical protein HXY25_06585 [Alphaproteobacteria bacterium]|nr:hypothetical protein [Alphaproteobacteria bacterium]
MSPRLPLLALCAAALALLSLPAAPARAYDPPRTPDGRPDFQGIWTNISLTNLERPQGIGKLVVSAEEAAAIVSAMSIAGVSAEQRDDSDFVDPNEGAPPKGSRDFGVQGYDSFWVDPGQTLARVNGEYRTSYIIDPPDGRLPYRDRGGILARRQKSFLRYVTGEGGNEGPEAMSLAERCLIGFGNTGGPGMLSVLYNNTYQFVQTADHFVILVEMNHDARIARIGGEHLPPAIRPWLGDTIARWEGDTLVMETRQIHPLQGPQGSFPLSPDAVVIERFTRTAEDEIVYAFTVKDPVFYTRDWTAELSFHRTEGPVYEYACHEGNYAMTHILTGARAKEAGDAGR